MFQLEELEELFKSEELVKNKAMLHALLRNAAMLHREDLTEEQKNTALNNIKAIINASTNDTIFKSDPVNPLWYPTKTHNAIIAIITKSIIILIVTPPIN